MNQKLKGLTTNEVLSVLRNKREEKTKEKNRILKEFYISMESLLSEIKTEMADLQPMICCRVKYKTPLDQLFKYESCLDDLIHKIETGYYDCLEIQEEFKKCKEDFADVLRVSGKLCN